MHVQHGANGQQVERERHLQRHACPAPPLRPSPMSESSSPKSYSKGGRTIELGDCALFQAGNGPPFIGILRKVIDKDRTVRLRVNWLYRPADLKLAKGVPTDAEPNEIFYSFHQDDTPAASLLHPCKVAFLRKGVELPSGISSFVCRRVYDVSTKRLWWLTDRDYTDEHQEEVDQLLNRTKSEMQAVIQQNQPAGAVPAPSPRTTTLSDNHTQQNSSGGSGKAGNKKRDREAVHETNSSKRSKVDDSESSFVKPERKPDDVAGLLDKDGGLQNVNGVEKLLNLMLQDRNDGTRQPVEVAARRIMLSGIVAATEKQECRDRLVHLGGLKVLDDWLQEAHKGKGGDGGSPVDGDKVSDELLLTVLRALQKLPVDLDALKACNVGKSVNNLKSHKNVEIHKKARKLVDTWKKRVDAEVKSGEKPGTPGKQDPLQSLNNARDAKSTGSSTKLNGDTTAKPVGSGSSRSATAPGSKESSPNNSASNEVQGKEEKSCASQSHPAWSSKEDVKGSTLSKSSSAARSSGASKSEAKDNKSNLWSRTASANTAERPVEKNTMVDNTAVDAPSSRLRSKTTAAAAAAAAAAEKVTTASEEVPSSQRLILRLPNPGKSPARTNVDASKTSSPKRLEKVSSVESEAKTSGSEKRHGRNGSLLASESRHNGKGQQHHAQPPAEGAMSLLATVATDEMLSTGTGSTVRSVVTEEGMEENMGVSSVPSEPQAKSKDDKSGTEAIPSRKPTPEPSPDGGDLEAKMSKSEEKKNENPAVVTGPPEDDALEVARQVAKEVEQEVEGYVKPPPSRDPEKKADKDTAVDETSGPDDNLAKAAAEDQVPPEKHADKQSSDKHVESVDQESDTGAGENNSSRPLFDLNQGYMADDVCTAEVVHTSAQIHSPSRAVGGALSAPIPVMASTNFIPPASLLKTCKDTGWKGSAATSAFRPPEDTKRKSVSAEKKPRPALEFDLNVADDGVISNNVTTTLQTENFLPSTAAKVVLDLNQTNESDPSAASLRFKPLGMSLNVQPLNFDLNDGPAAFEEHGTEEAYLRNKSKAATVLAPGGLTGEMLNLSSWIPSGGTSYPTSGISGFPGARPEQHNYASAAVSHPFMNQVAFSGDLYRGPPSSLGYQQSTQAGAATMYSYPGFPGFPFNATSTFPTSVQQHQHYAGSSMPASFSGISSSHFRPMGRSEVPAGLDSTGLAAAWGGRRGLDLNTGPDPSGAAAATAASLEAENRQGYVFPMEGNSSKRKEPESGWGDVYRNGGMKWQ